MKLPTVVSSEVSESHALLEIMADPGLIYFQGHFTGDAILPGVVQVGWAVEFAASLFHVPVSASGLRKIKFNHIIRPAQPVRLQLDLDRERNRLKYRYTGVSNDEQNNSQNDSQGQTQYSSGEVALGAD